jgi:hypothetical protein
MPVCVPIRTPIRITVGNSFSTSGRLLVRLNIKFYEEPEITGKNATSKKSSAIRSGTVPYIWQNVIPVHVSIVGIGCEGLMRHFNTR